MSYLFYSGILLGLDLGTLLKVFNIKTIVKLQVLPFPDQNVCTLADKVCTCATCKSLFGLLEFTFLLSKNVALLQKMGEAKLAAALKLLLK